MKIKLHLAAVFAAILALCCLAAWLLVPAGSHGVALAVPALDGLSYLGFGGLVLNRANLAILNQSFNALFKKGLTSITPMHTQIATVVPSTSSEEVYAWLGKSTKFREWLGDRVYQKLKVHGYTIKNRKFENTIEIERDEYEDDKYGVYNMPMMQLGEDAALHPDELVFGALKAGDASLCYDGQNFFDTDHPVIAEDGKTVNSVSNHGGGAGNAWYLLNVGRMLKPILFQKRREYDFKSFTNPQTDEEVFKTDKFIYGSDARVNVGYGLWQMAYMSKQALDETNFNAAMAAVTNFKFDGGKPVNSAGDWILLHGASNRAAALKVLTAELVNGGETNINRGTARPVLCPWLT